MARRNVTTHTLEKVQKFYVNGITETLGNTLYPAKAATEAALARFDGRQIDVTHPAYGAAGDGATAYATETAAFEAAIGAAAGDWVVVPPGTYDLGTINVTDTARIKLEEGAVLRKRAGSHSETLFNFTGTELTIRGPGRIDGNRQNIFNPTTLNPGRPAMISGDCQAGRVVDIEGVHFDNCMLCVRLTQFGGDLNFSGNRVTNQGQHTQQVGGYTAAVFIASGQVAAVSPRIRTNFNTLTFTDAEAAPGTAPGGFFVCTSDVAGGTTKSVGTPATWQAIGNTFYGYGQNHSSNEIGCIHSYPMPAQMRVLGNHFEHFGVTPINAKSVTDFVCVGNTFLNDVISSAYVPHAGTILYAPGYWSDEAAEAVQHYRAVISGNTIDNAGGTASQGAYGIVVNAVGVSHARDVVIVGNTIATLGNGVYLSYAKRTHVADNVIRSLTGTSAQQRGIDLTNLQGDIELVDNYMDVVGQGVTAVVTSNTAGRVWVKGNTIKSAGAAPIDLRGLALAVVTGNTVERVGGSTAVNITTDGTNPVAKLVYDRTNTVLTGTVSLSHANITAFEGQAPLQAAPSISAGSAAGTGATVSVSGDGDKGTITVTTGTGATTGGLATITFASTRRAAPIVLLTPATSSAAGKAANVYVSTVSTSVFIISVTGAALSDSTTYTWRYRID